MSIVVTYSVSSSSWTCSRLDFGDPATARLIVLLPGGGGGLYDRFLFLLLCMAIEGHSFGDGTGSGGALGSWPLLFCKIG